MESHFVSITLVISLFCGIADAAEVTWRTGDRLPDAMTAAAIRDKAAAWQAQHGQGGPRERHVLVQFTQPLSAERQDLLAGKGVQLLQPLGGNAFFAKIDASRIDATDLQQNHHIAGIHEIQRDWKIHPKLTAGDPPWAVISRRPDGKTPDRVVVYVLLHGDADGASVGTALAGRYNAVIRSVVASVNCLVVELPVDEVNILADEDSVQWIEPPPLSTSTKHTVDKHRLFLIQ